MNIISREYKLHLTKYQPINHPKKYQEVESIPIKSLPKLILQHELYQMESITIPTRFKPIITNWIEEGFFVCLEPTTYGILEDGEIIKLGNTSSLSINDLIK
jgi:hypothetical protein